jgi:hypothetical protein
MPRKKKDIEESEIPSTIARSAKHAQRIWKETHDSAVARMARARQPTALPLRH